MLCSVEGHVLQKVRQTILMVLFEDRTNGLRDVELATLLGLLIVTDVIRQSVVQLSITNFRINRQFLRRFLRRYDHRCHEQRDSERKSFHIFLSFILH